MVNRHGLLWLLGYAYDVQVLSFFRPLKSPAMEMTIERLIITNDLLPASDELAMRRVCA